MRKRERAFESLAEYFQKKHVLHMSKEGVALLKSRPQTVVAKAEPPKTEAPHPKSAYHHN
jgi:hypothetical protein